MIKKLDNSTVSRKKRPIRLLQFGEGNFLRAFADWQIDIANEQGVANIGIAIVKPRSGKSAVIDILNRQDGLYHVCLEGIENGKPKKESRLVTAVEKAFTPDDRDAFEEVILSPELRFVISNTTEAGIRYEDDDIMSDIPSTFPGKVAALL
ncbi:MAG: altronate oxidoreductase, partial [Muribaculaceae bacterium]|nr:altronate oxidoreductase [Muribaculaceae bacterium]